MKKTALFLGAVVLMLSLFGCGTRYKVDYCGDKSFYRDAKDSYPEGKQVRLVYNMIATDTDYSFYLDGEKLNHGYSEEGFVIEFTMPDHDVELRCEEYNSMDFDPCEE